MNIKIGPNNKTLIQLFKFDNFFLLFLQYHKNIIGLLVEFVRSFTVKTD